MFVEVIQYDQPTVYDNISRNPSNVYYIFHNTTTFTIVNLRQINFAHLQTTNIFIIKGSDKNTKKQQIQHTTKKLFGKTITSRILLLNMTVRLQILRRIIIPMFFLYSQIITMNLFIKSSKYINLNHIKNCITKKIHG